MPYIKRNERHQYQELLDRLAEMVPDDKTSRAGHMNYLISMLIEKVYGEDKRYADHNEVVGMLECVSYEFYRRKTAPYEDLKIAQEGDLEEL